MTAKDILTGGVRLVRAQPRAVAIWGLVNLAATVAAMLLLRPMVADMLDFQQLAMAAEAQGLEPPWPPVAALLGVLGMNAVLGVAMAVIFAAAVRAVGQGGDDRTGFLRLGGDEARLIGLGLLLWFGLILGLIGVAVGLGGVAALLAAILPRPAAAAVGAALFFASMGVMIWAGVRVSLAGVFTVLRGRIVIGEAWRATRGRFWTLLIVYLFIVMLFSAVTMALFAGLAGSLPAVAATGMSQQEVDAAFAQQRAMLAEPFAPRLMATAVISGVANILAIAFSFGAIATAAIGFDREDSAA